MGVSSPGFAGNSIRVYFNADFHTTFQTTALAQEIYWQFKATFSKIIDVAQRELCYLSAYVRDVSLVYSFRTNQENRLLTDIRNQSSQKRRTSTCKCPQWIIIPAFIVSLCLIGLLGIFIFVIAKVVLAIFLAGVVVTIICLVWGLSVRIVKKSHSKAWKIGPVASSTVFGVLIFAWLFPALTWPFPAFTLHNIVARKLHIDASHVRFPLPEISKKGITVDSKGRIYCPMLLYHRLQVYDRDGRFVKGWGASVPKFDRRLITDEHDHIHIIGRYIHDVYDSNGLLLSTRRGQDMAGIQESFDTGSSQTQDLEGNVYRIETGLTSYLFPKITKITPAGLQTTIIQDPWELWVLAGPFHAWLLAILWMLFVGLFLGIDRLIRSSQSQPATPTDP